MSDGTPGRPPGLREVFAERGYRRLWIARTASQWGDVVHAVTLSLLVYHLTGSGLAVSAVVAAEVVPLLLVAPFAGALVDRLPRVRVMIAADLTRAALLGVLVLFHSSFVLVLAVAAALSLSGAFFNPAAASLLPALVRTDALVAANSGLWTAAVLSQIVLAPLAGLAVVTAGFGWGFAVNAASYLVSALVLRRLRIAGTAPAAPRGPLPAQVAEGLRAIAAVPLLRTLALVQLLAALSAGATSALLVVYANEQLRVSGTGYGALLAAIGLGAVAGPLLLLRFVRRPRRPLFVFGPLGLRGGVDLVLASTSRLPLSAGALVGYGIGTSIGTVTMASLLQAETPDRLRGRVFATMDVLWQTGRLTSLGLGGLLAATCGIASVYVAGGVLLLLAAAYGVVSTRQAGASAA